MNAEKALSGDPAFHSKRLRTGRISSPGGVYLVTIVTRQRMAALSNLAAGRAVIGALRSCSNDAETICFVVMPDHFHWLLQLGTRLSISQVVSKTKAAASRALFTRHGELPPIWQRGFHDRRIRPSEDLRSVARYVIENPVRAGLVASIRDYPHWDASWL